VTAAPGTAFPLPEPSRESVISVFNIPAITWSLTAVLLLSGCYYFLQAAKSRQRTDRINKALHALMNVLMAAMLWNLVPSTLLAQIAVLSGAALWFVIQAVARPEFKTLCANGQSRIKCVYHSLSMAGAAIMIAMMSTGHTPGTGSASAAGTQMSHAHHGMAVVNNSAAATATIHQTPALALLLTVCFGAAAAVFFVMLVRHRATRSPRHTASSRFLNRSEHALEALGAMVMALMFATMAA
jgi:Domain of unknown function (DUF5134)